MAMAKSIGCFIKRLAIIVVLYGNWAYFIQVMIDTVSYAEDIAQPVSEASIFYLLVAAWITLMLAVLMAKEFGIEDWRWTRPRWHDFKIMMIYTAIFLSVTLGLDWLLYILDYRVLANQQAALWLQSMMPSSVFIIIVVFYTPIMEELIVRAGIMGYLFRNRPWLGGIVSTFLFAIAHSPTHPSAWIIYASMGGLFAWVFHRTKRIGFVIFIHMVNNALAVCFPASG